MRIDFTKSFPSTSPSNPTQAQADVAAMFGLGLDETKRLTIYDSFSLDIFPGQVILLTGPSGGGKTLLLQHLRSTLRTHPPAKPFRPLQDLADIHTANMPAVIDTFSAPLSTALYALSRAGLNDAPALLRTPDHLSDGQAWRWRLAQALVRNPATIIIDEFASTLDRQTACAIAYNIRKTATRTKTTFILATAHIDTLYDLQPDQIILKHPGTAVESYSTTPEQNQPHQCSLLRGITITPATIRDWYTLAPFHYRGVKLGPTDKIFKMTWQDPTGPSPLSDTLVGIIVYGYSMLNLRARNLAAPEIFHPSGKLKLAPGKFINDILRTITRIVIHPNWRGIGLATKLVKETIDLTTTPYVEASSSMGNLHPLLERAGMTRHYTPPRKETAQLINLFAQHSIPAMTLSRPTLLLRTLMELPEPTKDKLTKALTTWARYYIKGKQHPPKNMTTETAVRITCSHLQTRPVYYLWKKPDQPAEEIAKCESPPDHSPTQ